MKKKILMVGPFLSQSGYGEQARFAFNAVNSRPDLFDVFVINTNWGKTTWVNSDDEFRKTIDRLIKKTIAFRQAGGQFDINLQVSIPNEVQKLAPVNILYTAGIETTMASMQWMDKIRQLDSMIVVSNHAKTVFNSTVHKVQDQTGNKFDLKCEVPIDVVGYPVKKGKAQKLNLDLKHDFNFLAVAQWSPRKDMVTMLRSFFEEFHKDEVGLVLKTSVAAQNIRDKMATRNMLTKMVEKLREEYPDSVCSVHLLHGDLTEDEVRGLYKHSNIKAMLSTTHGEGYGLPLFEAAYSALPVVTHGWSGQADFLYVDGKPLFAECDYNIAPISREAVWQGVLEANSQWAYIDRDSFKQKMRDVFTDHEKYDKIAKNLKKHVHKEFEQEKIYNLFVDAVMRNFEIAEDSTQIVL